MSRPKPLTTEAQLRRLERGMVALSEILAITERINGRHFEEIRVRLERLEREVDELKGEPPPEAQVVKPEKVH